VPPDALAPEPRNCIDQGVEVACHLLLCATPSKPLCCQPERGAATWSRLKSLIRELGLEDPARSEGVVLRTKADCLRVCHDGPILLIWPDGITYGGVTAERIERIVLEHVIGGRPVQEWIQSRSRFADRGHTSP
jgi:(2Fe-2S) ferredoxin